MTGGLQKSWGAKAGKRASPGGALLAGGIIAGGAGGCSCGESPVRGQPSPAGPLLLERVYPDGSAFIPRGPATLSTWEWSSHRGPLEPTLSPQSGAFSVDGAPGPGFHIRAAYLPKGTRVGPSGPLACPQAKTQRDSSPNRIHQEGLAKKQEEWRPPRALWLFSGPKGHRALLGPVANFAPPCPPQAPGEQRRETRHPGVGGGREKDPQAPQALVCGEGTAPPSQDGGPQWAPSLTPEFMLHLKPRI